MRILYFLIVALLLFGQADGLRWDQLGLNRSLPQGANITLNGGDILGQAFATEYNTIVYPDADFTTLYAIYGGNRTRISSGPISPDYNTAIIRAGINATPENGTILIAGGPYSMEADINCTTGTSSYIYFWTALPITKDIHIKGLGRNATVLKYAADQYSSTRPALLMFDFCPFSESGGDGVGPGHNAFSMEDITFDGNVAEQEPYYHDGAGLFLSGSMRSNTLIRNVEFRNSPNHALYLGYNGGGWENHAVVENIYSHDNWGSSQIDNTEDTVINNFVSKNDSYGMWSASRMALVLDGMHANSGHLIVNNLHIIDGSLYIFGFWKSRDDLSMRLSNIYIDSREVSKHGAYIYNCNNVTLDDGKILSGTASYAVSVKNATGVTLDDMELRGYRGFVTETGYKSDVKLDGCDINTSGDCFMVFGTGSTALLTSCDLYTSNPTKYLVNVQSGASATLVGCRGTGAGLIYVGGSGGSLIHAGTVGLGLEVHGTATVADGGTIAHGMKITPRGCFIMPSLTGTMVGYSLDATDITVDFSGVETTQTVSYWAWY